MAEDRADEIMRHFDVVAERLESQIRLVAEGHSVLVNKLEAVDQHIADVRGELHSEIRVLADGQGVLRDEIKTFRTEVAGEFSELRGRRLGRSGAESLRTERQPPCLRQ